MDVLTVCITLVILCLGGLFFLRWKIVGLMSWGLKLAFPILLVIALSALFLPQVYNSGADLMLRQAGTYTTIRSLDKNIAAIGNVPGNILGNLGNIFNSGGSTQTNSDKPGFLESQLYVSLINLIGFLLRIFTLILSLIGMGVVLYLSYSTAGVTQSAELQIRVKQLEERLSALERNS